jgi:RNA polymerase sigma-70 factor (ECF subfamily)
MMTDEEYFDRIEPVRKKLYRIAWSYLGSESMAIDTVDEAVFQGYMKRKQLKNEKNLETWLVRVLINACNDELRRRKREDVVEELPEGASIDEYDQLPLKMAIEKLPKQLRQPVLLKYFGDYTTVQIAELLMLPQGTVASRLRRALELLRLELQEVKEG